MDNQTRRTRETTAYAQDPSFQGRLATVKKDNKVLLARLIYETCAITVDPDSIFDVQVKRIHAYKRQLLNCLHILHLYNKLLEGPDLDLSPRTFIFAGKAAPGYREAKQVIELINSLASQINGDGRVNDRLKVVFLENYSVSLAERIFPATDVSEQISLAGKEASGTGNMKSIMNGALIMGTLDGATVEIKQLVGDDNIFIFGLTDDEVASLERSGDYYSWNLYRQDLTIRRVVDQLIDGFLPTRFDGLHDQLVHNRDRFFVLKDFHPYAKAQELVDEAWRDRARWMKSSSVNIAHSGHFGSDRVICRYARDIWNIPCGRGQQ